MVQIQEDYSPRYINDTSKPLLPTITDHNDEPIALGGVNPAQITIIFKNIETGAVKTGKGTWGIVDATKGQLSYAWHADDVKDAGTWLMQVSITFPDGRETLDTRVIEFVAPLS